MIDAIIAHHETEAKLHRQAASTLGDYDQAHVTALLGFRAEFHENAAAYLRGLPVIDAAGTMSADQGKRIIRQTMHVDGPSFTIGHDVEASVEISPEAAKASSEKLNAWIGEAIRQGAVITPEQRAEHIAEATADLKRAFALDRATSSQAFRDVAAERLHQIDDNYTAEHDDQNAPGEMALAGAAYAWAGSGYVSIVEDAGHGPEELYPWTDNWNPTKGPRQNLVRGAALIIAEIEKIDRAAAKEGA